MNREKSLRIISMMIIVLFLSTSVSAMSIKQVTTKEPTLTTISQSDFIMDLAGNEKVVWQADYVTRDDDIAYVTVEENIELGAIPGTLEMKRKQPPQPLYPEIISYKTSVKNWWGRTLFYVEAKAYCRYSFLLDKYTGAYDRSGGLILVFSNRYEYIGFQSEVDLDILDGEYVRVWAEGYVRDWWLRRDCHLYAYAVTNGPGSGYIEWE